MKGAAPNSFNQKPKNERPFLQKKGNRNMRRNLFLAAAFVISVALIAGCGKSKDKETNGADAPETSTSKEKAADGVLYGKEITVTETSTIADIKKNAEAYDGKTVRVEGEIGQVCQMSGCWFYIADGTERIKVVLDAGSDPYVIPKGSKGKEASVQASVRVSNGAIQLIGMGNTIR